MKPHHDRSFINSSTNQLHFCIGLPAGMTTESALEEGRATLGPSSSIRQRNTPAPLNSPTSPGTSSGHQFGTVHTEKTRVEPSHDPRVAREKQDIDRRSRASRKLSVWKSMLIPVRPVGATPSIRQSIWAIVTASWLNVLLVFIPVSVRCVRSVCVPMTSYTISVGFTLYHSQ